MDKEKIELSKNEVQDILRVLNHIKNSSVRNSVLMLKQKASNIAEWRREKLGQKTTQKAIIRLMLEHDQLKEHPVLKDANVREFLIKPKKMRLKTEGQRKDAARRTHGRSGTGRRRR